MIRFDQPRELIYEMANNLILIFAAYGLLFFTMQILFDFAKGKVVAAFPAIRASWDPLPG